MPAKFIPVGTPAHDNEKAGIRFLVEGLPSNYTVYGNAWLVEPSGAIYEIDATVVAPHAVFVVEIKTYRGRIEGTDTNWWIPESIVSPIKLNRLTAQVLKSQFKRENSRVGQLRTEGFVFLSVTDSCGVKGPASNGRIHTRKTILQALQDPALALRLSGLSSLPPTAEAEKDILKILTGIEGRPRPVRHVREYEIVDTLYHHETFTEQLGKNRLSGAERVLRIYTVPPLASEEQRKRIEDRARWEAQVLGRLGKLDGILDADQPFADEAGIVLPLEHFKGVTLSTWLERYGPDVHGKERADLRTRTDLWLKIAQAIDDAHHQGVVHRLLRPEVVLVEDRQNPEHIRITGFDLAKQVSVETAISLTTIADDRLVYAAPEVVSAFSTAEPASDQFSLGALLALLLTGKPLFESTRQLMAERRMMRHVRDMASRIPLSLDEAVCRMVQLRPPERFPSLAEAIAAVRAGREPEARVLPGVTIERRGPIDADNLKSGDRVGTDYEIASRLGQGGMAVVYAAKHLVTNHTRALKIARQDDAAEEALRGEHEVLRTLDHANIVKVIDLSKMVEGRLTLVMERVSGQSLRQWLAAHPSPEPTAQRGLAEDLLAGLDYLEQKGVTHKDLKPENLLVGDGRLTIIDFSLAKIPEDALYGGTALYRDPASARFSHGTDRFAAALCLFELYAGRHAFEGRVPEPGQAPSIRDDEIDPSGLAAFFRKALDPVPEKRFPSARAMREALLLALGEDSEVAATPAQAQKVDASTPLRLTALSRRARKALGRGRIHTVGELLALTPAQVRAVHAIGTKAANEVIAFQEAVRGQGVLPAASQTVSTDPQLVPELADSPEPVEKLPLLAILRTALEQAGLTTIGSVASLTHAELLDVPSIGRTRLAQVVEALHQFRDRSTGGAQAAHTLDGLWDLASAPLNETQRKIVEQTVGIGGEPRAQGDIAADLDKSQPHVCNELSAGLERIDHASLADVMSAFDSVLDNFGGIARIDDLGKRLEEAWPSGMVTGEAIVRLLVRILSGRAYLVEVEGVDVEVVSRPVFDKETLRAFAAEVIRLAGQWPPVEPEAARRALVGLLPHFPGDPLALGVRLCEDVQVADTGHLFIGPVEAKQSIAFVLDQIREPISLEDLKRKVLTVFGQSTPYPDSDHLLSILRDLDRQVQGNTVVPGSTGSVVAPAALAPDSMPSVLSAEREPEVVVRDMLREASRSRGFRMLVTPPEQHVEIGRSVAAALKGTWVSFEDAFFADHGGDVAGLEKAERFVGQREALTEAAEQTLFRLLDEHGTAGNVIVLGDTALLGLCEALDLPRRLYDETLSGSRGFWVLVVPGVIHNRQPRFNEGPAMWHLEGATLPLLRPLPG
jgi:serine/threonine protein kinase